MNGDVIGCGPSCVRVKGSRKSLMVPSSGIQFVGVSVIAWVIVLKEFAIGIAAECNATTELFGLYGVGLSSATLIVSGLMCGCPCVM